MTTAAPTIDLASRAQSPKSFLFTSVIKSHLGEQASLIVSHLISHGRLSIQSLSSYTKLPIFNVKQALVSLVQLNIVTYFQDQKRVFYNFNEIGALKLVYSGDIINQINVIYNDESATKIVQNFLNFGYLTYQDCKTTEDDKIHASFLRLIKDQWLVPINKIHFQNKFDLYNELFKTQLLKFNRENKATSESKKISEVKQITNQYFAEALTPNIKYIKVVDGEERLIETVPFTFNVNRFLQRKRSLALQDLCKHKLGPLSAAIFAVVLAKFEKNSKDVINQMLDVLKFSNNIMITSTGLDPATVQLLKDGLDTKNMKATSFNSADILKEIKHHNKHSKDKKIKLKHSIISPTSLSREDDKPLKKKIKLEVLDDGFEVMEKEENEGSLMIQHLKLLAQNGFLRESSPGKFYIPIDEVKKVSKMETINQLIKLIFGQDALRIINCIKHLKLIDEKMLNNLLLMKDATIRSNLNRLVMFNILQLQEIPKTNDRLAIRTVFTFRFNEEHVTEHLISSLYYNLGEVLANIEHLKNESKILLDKSNRDDVRGKETEVLVESELIQLNEIYEAQLSDLKKFIRILSLVHVFEL